MPSCTSGVGAKLTSRGRYLELENDRNRGESRRDCIIGGQDQINQFKEAIILVPVT